MANWHLNYGINLNAKADKKMQCNLSDKGGNGIQLVMGGGIPDGGPTIASVIENLKAKADGLDDLDADDPQSHVKHLRAIAAFCTELADLLGG